MKKPTLLLIGLGHVGGPLLDLLVQDDSIGRVVACTRRSETGEARCNLARLTAATGDRNVDLTYTPIDLTDHASIERVLDRYQPDLVVSTASIQTWWYTELLPDAERARLEAAKFGAWLPIHLALSLSLMQGLEKAGFKGPVLTASFPDVVNSVLAQLDLAPTAGVGNVDELATKVKLLAARKTGVPLDSLEVSLVGHHSLEKTAFGGRVGTNHPPFHLHLTHEGRDVTESSDAEELLFEPMPLPGGPAWSIFTASSSLRLIRALIADDRTRLHAPAPRGLPGGYPVLVGSGNIEVDTIPGIELDAAISINKRSHPFDGISHIDPDGTAVMVPETADIMRAELGYDCASSQTGRGSRKRTGACSTVPRLRSFLRHRSVRSNIAGVDIARSRQQKSSDYGWRQRHRARHRRAVSG